MKESVLNLKLRLKNDKTIIEDSYFTAPLKILKPFYDNKGIKLCLLNVSAGVLEGDYYNININLNKKTELYLYSQSYTKIFKMKNGAAGQKLEVNMEEGSSFIYMPMPVIPFIASNYTAANIIHLKENCNLIFREIISSGRYKNGEIFAFSKFASRTKIYFKNKLIFMDNTSLKPKEQELKDIGLYEGYDHQANLIIFRESLCREEAKNKIINLLKDYGDIEFGISLSFQAGIVIRILGRSSDKLMKITDKICIELRKERL